MKKIRSDNLKKIWAWGSSIFILKAKEKRHMDLKEIGNKLAYMTIKWFLEDPTRISYLAVIVLFLFMYAIAYPLAYIADKKLEAEEEWKKDKTDTE